MGRLERLLTKAERISQNGATQQSCTARTGASACLKRVYASPDHILPLKMNGKSASNSNATTQPAACHQS
jgi:hypothetical protein